MDAGEILSEIRKGILQVKSLGNDQVTIDSLLEYLDSLEGHAGNSAPLDQANLDFQRVNLEQKHQWMQEMFRSVIASGQGALKSSLLVSGGSAAALLAFASSAWASLKPEGLVLLGQALLMFGIGVLLTATAYGTTYLSQSFYFDGMDEGDGAWQDKVGDVFLYSSVFLVLVSYCLFAWACLDIYQMMSMFNFVKPMR